MTLYPWAGEFHLGNPDSPVAVVTLSEELELPAEKVAIYGHMKTENLGIEKVIANTVSNPNIRFIIIFGKEIRGHKSGGSLMALHENGVDENNRVIMAPGAVPYIENLSAEVITRFREQVEIINMLDNVSKDQLLERIEQCISQNPGSFGEPMIAMEIKEKKRGHGLSGKISLHASILIDPIGKIMALECEVN